MPEKPDSKRGRVRTHFREHGEAATIEFGQTLGVKPARIKRWIKQWAEGPSPAGKGDPPVKVKAKAEGKPITGGKRIYLFDDQAKTGTLLKEGPEQSVIRLDNGNERTVSNDWFKVHPVQRRGVL